MLREIVLGIIFVSFPMIKVLAEPAPQQCDAVPPFHKETGHIPDNNSQPKEHIDLDADFVAPPCSGNVNYHIELTGIYDGTGGENDSKATLSALIERPDPNANPSELFCEPLKYKEDKHFNQASVPCKFSRRTGTDSGPLHISASGDTYRVKDQKISLDIDYTPDPPESIPNSCESRTSYATDNGQDTTLEISSGSCPGTIVVDGRLSGTVQHKSGAEYAVIQLFKNERFICVKRTPTSEFDSFTLPCGETISVPPYTVLVYRMHRMSNDIREIAYRMTATFTPQ
jgi:hypothetical protein